MFRSKKALIFVIVILAMTLLGCSSAPEPPINEEPTAILHQFNGNVAIGIAAQYAQVCTLQATQICTRANRNGDYILSDVQETQGWLEANFIDTAGNTTILHAPYFIQSDIIDGIVNINPTTDIITQIWLADSQELDLNTCIEQSCLNSTNALIDQVQIETIEANLSSILRPFWPVDANSIRTGDYIADPVSNELDLMHELINYVLDFENSNLEIWDNNNLLIAQVPISELVSTEFDASTGLYDVVLESEMEAALPFRRPPPSGSPAINISLIVNPSLFGVAPFIYEIDTTGTNTSLPDAILTFEHFIISPDASITVWTENLHTGTLSFGGEHDVIVEVTANTGERAIRGATITLDRDENTPATYGVMGSCRPQVLMVNDLNICLELLDGGTLNSCEENNTLIHVNNRCSRSTQLEGTFIGYCELLDNEVRRTHYQNPLKFTRETLETQRTRLQAVCEDSFGQWH